jgi:ADP-heptose:LPS heptosyltransferase
MTAQPAMLRRRVLIFHAGALGDFVLSWPLALALGRCFPQSRIIYVTQRSKGALAEKVLRVESDDVEHGWHHLYGNPDKLPDPCKRMLQSSHAIFTFVAKADDAWMKSTASIASPASIVPVEIKPTGGDHAVSGLLASLSSQPPIASAVSQMLASINSQGIPIRREPKAGTVLIHPGSGSPAKCWPIENFLQLVDLLKKKGRSVRFILGEVELERWPGQVMAQLESAAAVVRPASYVDLLTELSSAESFVGNDSGPGHLAGIVGVPTLILYGPTDPGNWKPLGPHVRFLRRENFSGLRAADVLQEV